MFTFKSCPLPPLSRVWVYLRDSGGDGQDLASQRAYVTAYCEHHRLEIARVFEDAAISGGSLLGRDDFTLMIELARQSTGPLVDGILYWDMKRFARNELDSQFYMSDLRRNGYRLVSLSDDIPDGEFAGVFEAFLRWKAQKDREDISKDSKRGLAFVVGMKDEQGCYLGLFPGRPPTFFKRGERYDTGLTRNDGRPRLVQRLVPDPATWELGKRAWQMRADRVSYSEIEAELRLFPHATAPASIYTTIFKNEIYIGRLHYGGRVYENFAPALATPEQWEAVQAQRYSRKPGASFATKAGKTSYLLSGLCKCAYCESAMHGMRNKRNDRTKYWRYYVCAQKWAKRDRCEGKQTSAERLEQAVIETVCNDVLTVGVVAELVEMVNAELSDQSGVMREIERALDELKETSRALDNLLQMAELTPSLAVARKIEQREMEQREIKRRLQGLEAKARHTSLRVSPAQVAEELAGQRATLRDGALRARQALLRRVVERVEVSRDVAEIHYQVQLPTLVDCMPPMGIQFNQCRSSLAAL